MYWDLLPRIQNAERAGKDAILSPFSKTDFAVAQVLVESGYIKETQKKVIGKKSFLEVRLSSRKALSGFKFISKSSRHIYVDYRNIKSVRSGYGLGVYSTSRGVMNNKNARKNKVGGEYLFEIW